MLDRRSRGHLSQSDDELLCGEYQMMSYYAGFGDHTSGTQRYSGFSLWSTGQIQGPDCSCDNAV